MLHKFRRAMVNLERESLRSEVAVDDTWISGLRPVSKEAVNLKAGKRPSSLSR
jgi:hypothetical protein